MRTHSPCGVLGLFAASVLFSSLPAMAQSSHSVSGTITLSGSTTYAHPVTLVFAPTGGTSAFSRTITP